MASANSHEILHRPNKSRPTSRADAMKAVLESGVGRAALVGHNGVRVRIAAERMFVKSAWLITMAQKVWSRGTGAWAIIFDDPPGLRAEIQAAPGFGIGVAGRAKLTLTETRWGRTQVAIRTG